MIISTVLSVDLSSEINTEKFLNFCFSKDFKVFSNVFSPLYVDTPTIISYWQRGKVNHDGYVSHLPTLMDFPLQMSFNESLTDGYKYGMGFSKPYRSLASDFLYPDPNSLLVFPDNHDMARFFTQVKKDIDFPLDILVSINPALRTLTLNFELMFFK